MSERIVVFVTCGSEEEAKKISRELLDAQLIACANVVPSVLSIFRWQGKIDEESEVLIVIKSVKTNLAQIVTKVKAMHSYDVPEIIAMPIIGGSDDYLRWVDNETMPD
ncbi:MAG: divalent-cation tolerance protein CutA [bacterium]